MGHIQTFYGQWLEGALSAEDSLFQIGDLLQMQDEPEAEGTPSHGDQ